MVIFHGYLKSPEAKSHISWEDGGHGLTAAGFGGPWLPRRLAGVEPGWRGAFGAPWNPWNPWKGWIYGGNQPAIFGLSQWDDHGILLGFFLDLNGIS